MEYTFWSETNFTSSYSIKKKKKNLQQNNPECKSGKTKKQYPTNITNALMEQASHGVNIQKKKKLRKEKNVT